MYKLLVCFIIITGLVSLGYAQGPQENLGIVFRVQLAASTKPLPKDNKLYKDFADLEGVRFPDGYIRYMTGSFEGYAAAQDHLAEVKKKGYTAAYITALQGTKRMTPDEAIQLIYDSK